MRRHAAIDGVTLHFCNLLAGGDGRTAGGPLGAAAVLGAGDIDPSEPLARFTGEVQGRLFSPGKAILEAKQAHAGTRPNDLLSWNLLADPGLIMAR